MKKHEVELMIIGINMGKEEILNMKIYKDGTLCRRGCGGLPTIPVSGMTLEGDTKYWDQLFPLVDEQIVENPVMYQDPEITSPLEYFIAFFGVSSNGQTGEHAQWTKTSGMRFLLDNDTTFRHPLLGFLDGFAIEAAKVTNEWFFDIVMTAVFDHQPLGLGNTFVTVPKTHAEKQEALSRYVNQIMANSARGWDIVAIGNGRKYKSKEGRELTASVKNNAGGVSINFYEVFGKDDAAAADARIREILAQDIPATSAPASDPAPAAPKTDNGSPWWRFWH